MHALLCLLGLLLSGSSLWAQAFPYEVPDSIVFSLTSPAFKNGDPLTKQYTKEGGNVSLPLKIDHIPDHARSLAVVMVDLDGPDGPFTHWLVWNLPRQTWTIPENIRFPVRVVVGQNDFGNNRYDGPDLKPGSGVHHYEIRVYALHQMLDLPPETKREQLLNAFNNLLMAQTALTVTCAAPDAVEAPQPPPADGTNAPAAPEKTASSPDAPASTNAPESNAAPSSKEEPPPAP
ncbi:MAG: YbhB/YbcL family Raf kinase inhibitor-like protein [Verrucomicrobium sp.]|nr:YbhB/YbcL family Raf kinase inhibitor-like protein [Verrucomicrobium sp.]